MTASHYWIAYLTIVRKEIKRFLRIWIQTILPPVITTALYFIIFGHLIGNKIGEMDGYRYIDFIIPGLIMMTVITNSFTNVVASFYSAKFQGNIAEMLVSPLPNSIILAGYVSGGVARGLIVGCAVTLVSLFFNELSIAHWGITLSITILTSVVFSLAGLINAIFANSFDDINIIPTFVLTPLTYLGGVFYSVKMLSPFWQTVSFANPILYMVNGFRYGILGQSDISIAISYSVLVIFSSVLGSIAWYMLNTGRGIRS